MGKYYPLPAEDETAKESAELEAELRANYPLDAGLFYVQVYMQTFEPDLSDESLNNLRTIIKFGRSRRDAPAFVRKTIGHYIDSTGHVATTPFVDQPEQIVHGNNLYELQVFKARFPLLYSLAIQIIRQHYQEELEGKKVNRLKHERKEISVLDGEPAPEERLVLWFNRASMTEHFQGIDSQRETAAQKNLIKKLLATEERKRKISIKDEAIFDKMEKDFPNFKSVIRYYKAQFRLNEETNKIRINPVLLLGSPGIGKSQFTKRLAKDLETRMEYLDMSASSNGWVLNGLDASWSSAKVGKIAEALMYGPTVNPIVVLDEIEKAAADKKHSPLAPLYSLLEENTAKEFIDEFIDHPIDASGVIYIACANSLEGISEPLLTRLKVFNVPDPTKEEKMVICQRIYEQCTDHASLFNRDLDKDLLADLMDKSLREVKQILSDAVANSLLEYTKQEISEMKSKGEVIQVERRHLNVSAHKTKQKFGF